MLEIKGSLGTAGQINYSSSKAAMSVLVSLADAELLEYLEDQEDVRAARKALGRGGPDIPWQDARKRLKPRK